MFLFRYMMSRNFYDFVATKRNGMIEYWIEEKRAEG